MSPLETKRAAAPRVTIATTDAEKEEIYRLRYEVYIEETEGERRHTEANVAERRFRDELDDHAVQFYIRQDGKILGCVRLNLRRDGPWECEHRFDLGKLAPTYPTQIAMASRFAVHPGARGSVTMMQLCCAMAEFLVEQEQRFLLVDCHPKFLPLYTRLGFRIYKPGFKHPKYTYVIPMVFVFGDLEYLERVNSPLVPIFQCYPQTTEWRDLLLRNFPAAAHTFMSPIVDVEAFWGLLGANLGPTADIECPDVLAGLTEGEAKHMVSMGQIVSCHAGDPILCTGEQGREIFLILEGSFQVLGEMSPHDPDEMVVKILVPGDIFGEMAFLTNGHCCSTVVAMENSMLLVLNAKALDRIVTSEPQLAAKVFRNLARVVESAYYETILLADRPVSLMPSRREVLTPGILPTSYDFAPPVQRSLNISDLDRVMADIFRGLEKEEMELLVSLGRSVICRPGQIVIREGDRGGELFVILEGSLMEMARSDRMEGDAPAVYLRGDVVGETPFVAAGVRNRSVIAMEESGLLGLSAEALHNLALSVPRLAAKVFRNLAGIVATRFQRQIEFSGTALIPTSMLLGAICREQT
ncbi:MAG: cyclic nucleotide-binding domain-containing protein [Nitrospirota bacterium]